MISLIAAIGKNGELGKDGKLLWRLPHDLARFKKLTSGHAIIMGRKTFEAIGKPLPDRRSIIVTRNLGYSADGAETAASIKDAVARAGSDAEIFVIGGGEIYQEALPYADRIYLTRVDGAFDADAFFPSLGPEWKTISSERHETDERHAWPFAFDILEK